MRRSTSFRCSAVFSILAVILLASSLGSAAPAEKILHAFSSAPLGNQPDGALIADAAGDLYGVTIWGGDYDLGEVYELVRNSQGTWSEKVLYSFKGGTDIYAPGGRLTLDSAGNLFGAAAWGGLGGVGGLFELSPRKTGQWRETILHVFPIGSGGYSPNGGMVFDGAGNLYGTTTNQNTGTVAFKLTPSSSGTWTFSTIYKFPSDVFPSGDLTLDRAGNIYLTTTSRFSSNGTVFKLSLSGHLWTGTTLYAFTGNADGSEPVGGVIFDSTGNLYGLTMSGGIGTGCSGYPCGVVFKLSPQADGSWVETVIHNFQGAGVDGYYAVGTLTFDSPGNLYGTTYFGGAGSAQWGTVFELTPGSDGQWTESLPWSFTDGIDGANPVGVLVSPAGLLYATASTGGRFSFGSVIELSRDQGGQWSESTIADFPNREGAGPKAGLISDSRGNLYGTTTTGGAFGFGAVFELKKSTTGSWKEIVLYSFDNGISPRTGAGASSLIFDAAGNLYGETAYGGKSHFGSVFELFPISSGWTEKTIYVFKGPEGRSPQGGLVFDQAGNLYGTTKGGGAAGCGGSCGTVFELSPGSSPEWNETVLYRFAGGSDGANPVSGVILDAAGNIYGTTPYGGEHSLGTVFELSLGPNGWTETQLYRFTGTQGDGTNPMGGLVFDSAGNLYGTTLKGGSFSDYCYSGGCGTVFQLSPTSGGWKEKILVAFTQGDGSYPSANLILDPAGNLYGTTGGGLGYVWGSVFELSPASGSSWTETVLHTFGYPSARDPDGYLSYSTLLRDSVGNLYGTTVGGGVHNGGVVFEIAP